MAARPGEVDVSAWTSADIEQMGSKEKQWCVAPDDSHWLYKKVRKDKSGRGDYGDDWAEWCATATAELLGVPAADVAFANALAGPGTVSARVNDPARRGMVHGNEVMAALIAGYDPATKHEYEAYTVGAVYDSLRYFSPPLSWSAPGAWTAFDVWAGYLVLDALVANQDRHHENWAVLVQPEPRAVFLAPSFDHGSSLGFNLTEDAAADLLADGQRFEAWASKGRQQHLAGRPSLVEAAAESLSLVSVGVRDYWCDRVASLAPAKLKSKIEAAPGHRMSDVRRRFVVELVQINQRRFIRDCG